MVWSRGNLKALGSLAGHLSRATVMVRTGKQGINLRGGEHGFGGGLRRLQCCPPISAFQNCTSLLLGLDAISFLHEVAMPS